MTSYYMSEARSNLSRSPDDSKVVVFIINKLAYITGRSSWLNTHHIFAHEITECILTKNIVVWNVKIC